MITRLKLERYIGKVVLQFVELEEIIEQGIAQLINDRTDETGHVTMSDMTFEQKLRLWNRISYLHIEWRFEGKDRQAKIESMKQLYCICQINTGAKRI